MKCADKKKWLSFLREGMSDDQMEDFEKHLKTCSRCRKLAAELTRVYAELDDLEEKNPGEYFTSQVAGKIRSVRQTRDWERVLIPAFATVAAAFAVVLGIFLGHNLYVAMQDEDTEQPYESAAAGHLFEDPSVKFYIQGGS